LHAAQRADLTQAGIAGDRLEQPRADQRDAAGGSGRTANRAVLAAVHVLTPADARQRRWQAITAAALLAGYAGYYVCRSNLSVVAPQLLSEFGPIGVHKAALGLGSSAARVAYPSGQ